MKRATTIRRRRLKASPTTSTIGYCFLVELLETTAKASVLVVAVDSEGK